MAGSPGDGACPQRPLSPADPGQDRALASDAQEPHPARALLPARRSRTPGRGLRGSLQPCPLSREPGQSHAGRRLLRTSRPHPPRTRKDQAPDNRQPSLAASTTCRIISITDDPEPPFWKPAICLKSSDDGQSAHRGPPICIGSLVAPPKTRLGLIPVRADVRLNEFV